MTLKQNLKDKINGKTIFNDKMKNKDGDLKFKRRMMKRTLNRDKKATGKTFTTN